MSHDFHYLPKPRTSNGVTYSNQLLTTPEGATKNNPKQRLKAFTKKLIRTIVNKNSPHDNTLIGDSYMLEAFDQKHRPKAYLLKWWEKWYKAAAKENFFSWLDKQPADRMPEVRYLTPAELEENYKLRFDQTTQGDFRVRIGNSPADTNSDAIYVFKDNQFYVGNKKRDELHHSSLSAGKIVGCAGSIKIHAGKIIALDNFSGHYVNYNYQGAITSLYHAVKAIPPSSFAAGKIITIVKPRYPAITRFLLDQRGRLGKLLRRLGKLLAGCTTKISMSPQELIRRVEGSKLQEQRNSANEQQTNQNNHSAQFASVTAKHFSSTPSVILRSLRKARQQLSLPSTSLEERCNHHFLPPVNGEKLAVNNTDSHAENFLLTNK